MLFYSLAAPMTVPLTSGVDLFYCFFWVTKSSGITSGFSGREVSLFWVYTETLFDFSFLTSISTLTFFFSLSALWWVVLVFLCSFLFTIVDLTLFYLVPVLSFLWSSFFVDYYLSASFFTFFGFGTCSFFDLFSSFLGSYLTVFFYFFGVYFCSWEDCFYFVSFLEVSTLFDY